MHDCAYVYPHTQALLMHEAKMTSVLAIYRNYYELLCGYVWDLMGNILAVVAIGSIGSVIAIWQAR